MFLNSLEPRKTDQTKSHHILDCKIPILLNFIDILISISKLLSRSSILLQYITTRGCAVTCCNIVYCEGIELKPQRFCLCNEITLLTNEGTVYLHSRMALR